LKKDLRLPRELVEDKLNDTVYDIPNLKKVREEINKKSNKAEFVTKDMLCNSLNALKILPQKGNPILSPSKAESSVLISPIISLQGRQTAVLIFAAKEGGGEVRDAHRVGRLGNPIYYGRLGSEYG